MTDWSPNVCVDAVLYCARLFCLLHWRPDGVWRDRTFMAVDVGSRRYLDARQCHKMVTLAISHDRDTGHYSLSQAGVSSGIQGLRKAPSENYKNYTAYLTLYAAEFQQ